MLSVKKGAGGKQIVETAFAKVLWLATDQCSGGGEREIQKTKAHIM